MTRPLIALACVLALVGAGCLGGGGSTVADATLVWGIAADPVALDPALAPDTESRRVQSQVFEGLVALDEGTAEVVPALATRWTPSPDGHAWTFELREDVKFHDGTPLTSTAVCTNFDRWHSFRGSLRSVQASFYWQRVFGGFEGQRSLYRSCVESGPSRVVLELTEPNAAFLAALALPAFGIASPRALITYNADAGTVDPARGFVPAGTFATDYPIGTGPFKLASWVRGDRVVLERNDDYWGDEPALATLVFRVIPAPNDRLTALKRNEIQGFDLVDAQDAQAITDDPHLELLDRPAFNVGYLTINIARPPMELPLVRRAIAYGLDRETLAASFPGGRASVATQFLPPGLPGYTDDVPKYRYDPERARALLREAGLTPPVRLEFWYPVGVSRPYMPEPTRTFAILAESLEKAGFRVVARSAAWDGDYLQRVDRGTAGHVNLVGWTGDWPDPDNFLGTFFQQPTTQFGFDDPPLFRLLEQAEREPDEARRTNLYEDASRRVMENVYSVPLVYAREAVALRRSVEGYITSPLRLEPFSLVSLTE